MHGRIIMLIIPGRSFHRQWQSETALWPRPLEGITVSTGELILRKMVDEINREFNPVLFLEIRISSFGRIKINNYVKYTVLYDITLWYNGRRMQFNIQKYRYNMMSIDYYYSINIRVFEWQKYIRFCLEHPVI